MFSGHFREWDYGLIENIFHYGSIDPPNYPLIKITAPVYLLYSKNDWLAAETDVLRLYSELGNPQARLLVSDVDFNHLDYLYAIEAPELIYPKIVSIFADYR